MSDDLRLKLEIEARETAVSTIKAVEASVAGLVRTVRRAETSLK